MPAEYVKQKEALIKAGKNEAEAQKIAAASFFKRKGITVQEAHKKAQSTIRRMRAPKIRGKVHKGGKTNG
jgi:hypothetical protein